MTTVQLQLPFDPPLPTLEKHSSKWRERSRNTNVSVVELNSHQWTDALVNIAREYCEEIRPQEKFDPIAAYVTFGQIIANHQRQASNGFVALRDGVPVGFIVASVAVSLYSDYRTGRQDFWYVLPQYRGGLAAPMLLDTAERWARSVGADTFVTGSANATLAEKTNSVLIKMGYERLGSVYAKELGDGW